MSADPRFIVATALAAVIAGLAKGGFAGIGVLGVPLPILIVPDVVSV